jgi:16S rRNA processing protein RimM
MTDYIKVGKTLKAHGIKGELKVDIEPVFLDDFEELKAIFLEIKGQKIPFFVEQFRGDGMLILKLEELKDRTIAEGYQFKDIYVNREHITASNEEIAIEQQGEFYYLKGFTLEDKDLGVIGVIEAVEEYPQQYMAVIIKDEKEILVPLARPFITAEDRNAKRIFMDLPEGLLEL